MGADQAVEEKDRMAAGIAVLPDLHSPAIPHGEGVVHPLTSIGTLGDRLAGIRRPTGTAHINSKNDSRPMWGQNFSTRPGSFPSAPATWRSIQRSIEPRKHHRWTRNVLASSSASVNRKTFMMRLKINFSNR